MARPPVQGRRNRSPPLHTYRGEGGECRAGAGDGGWLRAGVRTQGIASAVVNGCVRKKGMGCGYIEVAVPRRGGR
jgi:hypothetical protein